MQPTIIIMCVFTLIACLWATTNIVLSSKKSEKNNNNLKQFKHTHVFHPYIPKSSQEPWYLVPLNEDKKQILESQQFSVKFLEPKKYANEHTNQ